MAIDTIKSTAVLDGAIATADIADDAVTSAKLDTNIAVDGDLTVDTSTLKVDSSNNRVGIGTASPGRKLELNNGGTGAFVTFTDGVATNFTFKTDGSNVGTFGTEAGSTHLAFMSSGTERMRIDSSGRVTMPNVPRFLARKNTSSWTLSANSIIVWDSTSISYGYNVGSHYNTSNGKFTCPVSGTYYFEATSIVNTIVTNGAWYLRKNGSSIHEQHITQTSNGWTAHHIAFTGEFAASDTVEVYLGSAPTGFYGQAWSFFHGRMIG